MSIKVSIDVNFEISLCVLKECATAHWQPTKEISKKK